MSGAKKTALIFTIIFAIIFVFDFVRTIREGTEFWYFVGMFLGYAIVPTILWTVAYVKGKRKKD